MKTARVPANFIPADPNISEMVRMLDVAEDSRFVAIYSLTVDSASIYNGEQAYTTSALAEAASELRATALQEADAAVVLETETGECWIAPQSDARAFVLADSRCCVQDDLLQR